jgi:hypothetical protein
VSVNKIDLNSNSASGNNLSGFIKSGFGFSYRENEINSMNEFIHNYGSPLLIERSKMINKNDGITDEMCVLKYKDYEICFLNFTKRDKWKAPESMMMYIASTDKGTYRYGIQIGDRRNKLEKLFDIKIDNDKQEFKNDDGNIVTFIIKNDKLEKIYWEYGRE